MTLTALQQIAADYSQRAWVRIWPEWTRFPGEQVTMAIQFRDNSQQPERVPYVERFGLMEGKGGVYTARRTNEDGSPFVVAKLK